MTQDTIDIAVRLASALAAGSLIGLERSVHGRPAGFRTHALVCLASALLMLVTAYQWEWLGVTAANEESFRTDPTRMAQGIMTGIGFLGAGVIFKEGLTVRGLTTAASIWITAAIGILYGVGFFYPAILGTLATLGTLAAFAGSRLAFHSYLRSPSASLRQREGDAGGRRASLLSERGFTVSLMSYRQSSNGAEFDYRMVIRTADRQNMQKLAEKLRTMPAIIEFRISPTGD